MDDLTQTQALITTALKKFEELTGFVCKVLEREPVQTAFEGVRADARVEVRVGPRAPFAELSNYQANQDAKVGVEVGLRPVQFFIEVKRNVDRVNILEQVKNQIQHFDGPGLLITRYLTQKLAKQCREMDLPFMDTAGNAFLRNRETFVWITGQQLEAGNLRAEKMFRAFDRTGLKVLYAFICQPELLNAPYRDIAKAAGVALGTVGWIFTDLREHGFLVDAGKGERRLLDRERLHQGWIGNYPTRLRNKLKINRYRAPDPDWWKDVQPREYGAYWGGEVAGAKLTDYLIPNTYTLYTMEDPKNLILRYRLQPDPFGEIEILDAFWEAGLPQAGDDHPDVVHPILVEADLIAIGDPRTIETAKMIRGANFA